MPVVAVFEIARTELEMAQSTDLEVAQSTELEVAQSTEHYA
jgi:hypothetical protein